MKRFNENNIDSTPMYTRIMKREGALCAVLGMAGRVARYLTALFAGFASGLRIPAVSDTFPGVKRRSLIPVVILLLGASSVLPGQSADQRRPRARDLGIKVGVLAPGPFNSITDVAGVRVGQTTLINGDNVRTGVTAILPHG